MSTETAAQQTVSIVMTRAANTSSKRPFGIRISDDASGVLVCEIEMTAEEFAGALTAAHTPGVHVSWAGVHNIGKTREVKHLAIVTPDGPFKTRDQRAQKACAEFEVDGWSAYYPDATNDHKRSGMSHRVTFSRYV